MDIDVQEFCEANGITDPKSQNAIDLFVQTLKANVSWSDCAVLFGQSALNKGFGLEGAQLGGWTVNPITLERTTSNVQSPIWTVGGLSYNGTSARSSVNLDGIQTVSDLFVFARIVPTEASTANAITNRPRWSFGSATIGNRGINSGTSTFQLTGEKWMGMFSNSVTRRLGSTSFEWGGDEDFTEVSFFGSSGMSVWKNKTSIPLDLSNGMTTSTACGPSATGWTTDNLFRDGTHVDGAVVSMFSGTIICRVAIKTTLTQSQREAITDAINDLPITLDEIICRFGYISDIHYSSTQPDYTTRNPTDGLLKTQAAVDYFNSRDDLDFVSINGDLIDHDWAGGTPELAESDLQALVEVLSTLQVNHYYTLGNHEFDQLNKADIYANTGMPGGYYSFETAKSKVIVLDSCFRSDSDSDPYLAGDYDWTVAYIPPAERTWLTTELSSSTKPVIILSHQILAPNLSAGNYNVTSGSVIRAILSDSNKVKTVIQGHRHVNAFERSNSISYWTMNAATEGNFPQNAYAVVQVYRSGRVDIFGFGNQTSLAAPWIDNHPSDLVRSPGQSALFTVDATGSGTLEYQWYKDGIEIEGATSSSYEIESVTEEDVGEYTCLITNSEGSVESDGATLLVSALQLTRQILGAAAGVSSNSSVADNILREHLIYNDPYILSIMEHIDYLRRKNLLTIHQEQMLQGEIAGRASAILR